MKQYYRLQQLSKMTGIELSELKQYEEDDNALSPDEKSELKKAKRDLLNKRLVLIFVLLFFFGTIVLASGSIMLALASLGSDYNLISTLGYSEIGVGLIFVIISTCVISIRLFKHLK